MNQMNDMNRYL